MRDEGISQSDLGLGNFGRKRHPSGSIKKKLSTLYPQIRKSLTTPIGGDWWCSQNFGGILSIFNFIYELLLLGWQVNHIKKVSVVLDGIYVQFSTRFVLNQSLVLWNEPFWPYFSLSNLYAHFQSEFSTPHPDSKAIPGPWYRRAITNESTGGARGGFMAMTPPPPKA